LKYLVRGCQSAELNMARGREYAKKTAGIQRLYVEKEKSVKYGTFFKRRQKGVKPRSIPEATRKMEALLLL
jgi:hypothetical protein